MSRDPYRYFRIEAHELREQLVEGVLALERGVSPEAVRRLLRLAHTLKGAARVVRESDVADRAHAIEGALAPLAPGGAAPGGEAGEPVTRQRIDEMLGHLESIGARLAALSPPSAPRRPGAEEGLRAIRPETVETAELDALLNGLGEAHVELAALRAGLGLIEQARHTADLLSGQLSRPRLRETLREASGGGGDGACAMALELSALVAAGERTVGAGVDRLDRELREVLGAAERMRLVPAGALFNALELAARDAAVTLGRRAAFTGHGGEVRLEAGVLGTVGGALQQMVRNAVAHGLEPDDERRAAGKPPEGRVSVEVERRGARIAFLCRDDGRGIDLEAVRRAAQRQGVLSGALQGGERDELLRLLLQGGLTTAGSLTEMSGRGVGLDVVRTAAGALGGEVQVQTWEGQGTLFSLVVPVSVSSLQALLVEAAGVTAAIPLSAVQQTVRIAPPDLIAGASGPAVILAGRMIPFFPLDRALRRGPSGVRRVRPWSAVVFGGARPAAVGVDRLIGVASVVLRSLPELAAASRLVAGAFLDAAGDPQLVLDPEALLAEALRRGEPPAVTAAAGARAPILVIDDSLTTRMLEQSILESAGYEVDLATSAEQALDKARNRRYGLFLVDVEMPGMDGFAFVERVRADPHLRGIPAVLVTSRSAPEDRRRGDEAGADGYMVKSEFDQTSLLQWIHQLVSP